MTQKKSLDYSIDTITFKQVVELIEIIWSLENDDPLYTVDEINQCLHKLTVADKDGIFYTDEQITSEVQLQLRDFLSENLNP